MSSFAFTPIVQAIHQLLAQNTLENAQHLAALLNLELTQDLLSDDPNSPNYRYKDIGYIAGSRKEQAQASILAAKKEGLQVFATDIDWDALEENSRIAADTITKKNVFGQVDWEALKAGGMHGNVGYLIKRIYAAVALKPDFDDAKTRKLYVIAIQNLRQIFEKCKTYEEAKNEVVALSKLLNTYRNIIKGEDGNTTLNYDSQVAHALGKKLKSWVFKTGNDALYDARKMAIDDWSWLEPSDKMTTTAPKKKPFQLEAAADINRVGGAKVDIKSTEQFKDAFGLKAIQSGNWVLKDKESIEFHVQRAAEAMSDMADVTGIPANLLGFGGRLGLSFGARGKGSALAHYEPVQRVINITKMKGGGSLGHEYFHALDNIIRDLMHQKDNGAAGYFATENPDFLPDGLVKTAFQALRQAMKVSARNSRMITITEDMRRRIKSLTVVSLLDNLRLKHVDLSTPNKVIEALASHAGNRYTGVYKNKEITQQGVYVVLACMIHLGMMTGNENEVEFPILWEQSDFEKSAIELDGGKQGKYWSKPLEMAARAYSAYLQDRLDEQGRVNDYLAYSTKGGNSRVGEVAYPQGKEREAINAAFDQLFAALREQQVFENAVSNQDLMNAIFANSIDSFNDIGGFNFIPEMSFDATLNAIKALMANNTEDNAKRLAVLVGLSLEKEESLLDFDLFGEPIQDGDSSPVEELPRLAVVELPLDKLTLSDDVPQFKSGADGESGVVEALGGKFDRTGVAPIQVWERTDGRLEIISGRHRTDLARRSGEKAIPAQVHKESEGFTAKQAMMLDAELNIRDGQGKVKDYVDYFTHSEISEEEADKRGLLARSIGQRAFTIASKGSEELKTLHRNEIISDQAAAEIASIAPSNSAMQAVGLRVLQEHKPLNNALNTIRAVQALTREKGQEPDTFDLFGFDNSALKEAEAMARIASRKQRQIAEQLNAIKGAVKNPKLAAKHGVVVENEADALAKVQEMTAQKARWDNWSSHADLLAEVRTELNDVHNNLGVIDGSSSSGWIGVDLDGTLAKFYGWDGIEKIGEPIPPMLERVNEWLSFGFDVRIFTARAANPEAIPYIKQWCREHIGQELPITNVKDMYMAQIWDDKAVTIQSNTGEIIKSEVEIPD